MPKSKRIKVCIVLAQCNNSPHLLTSESILEGYTTKIDQLEDLIGKLEEVTGELDQWSKELELKVKNTN